ncbi:hypothetical protein EVAR_65053_1 [Eumeta japonica]|uniref:Uncharacterized protein n=1 Tax=Eumeta variegata TaxID=151549 RepID=A0A4C2ADV9_EUMVA|nr:hypothetical protein EVAR_65053_1 [Eumeta japonica]
MSISLILDIDFLNPRCRSQSQLDADSGLALRTYRFNSAFRPRFKFRSKHCFSLHSYFLIRCLLGLVVDCPGLEPGLDLRYCLSTFDGKVANASGVKIKFALYCPGMILLSMSERIIRIFSDRNMKTKQRMVSFRRLLVRAYRI